MRLSEIRKFVEHYFVLDLGSKYRGAKNVYARAVYFKYAYDTGKYTKVEIGKSVGRDHSCVINAIGKFDDYLKESLLMQRCYDLLTSAEYKPEPVQAPKPERAALSKPIEKAVKMLSEMTDLEVIEFLPRIELYHKSNINKKQRQQQWQQQKQQA